MTQHTRLRVAELQKQIIQLKQELAQLRREGKTLRSNGHAVMDQLQKEVALRYLNHITD